MSADILVGGIYVAVSLAIVFAGILWALLDDRRYARRPYACSVCHGRFATLADAEHHDAVMCDEVAW